MGINLNTEKHCAFIVKFKSICEPIEALAHKLIRDRKASTELRSFNLDEQVVDIVNAALYANDINLAEIIDLMCALIGYKFYSGKLRKLLAFFHITIEQLAATRNAHLKVFQSGAPIFRHDPIIIELENYGKLRDAGFITNDTNTAQSLKANIRLLTIIAQFEEDCAYEAALETALIPEDEWYPNAVVDDTPDFNQVLEADNDHFLHKNQPLDSKAELVEILPNNQKLIKLNRPDGKMHYLVVGEDVDVTRLPKIYNMFLREELHLGPNITTDRLTRIIKIQEMLEIGFTRAEVAEYLAVPRYIVDNDLQVLRKIEFLNATTGAS